METNKNKSAGQQSNQNWDDQNDQQTSGSREPNPERFNDKNLGQGHQNDDLKHDSDDQRSGTTERSDMEKHGSAFNERHQSTSGYGSSQQDERKNVGPLDADFDDLPSEKRFGNNQSGPGLG